MDNSNSLIELAANKEDYENFFKAAQSDDNKSFEIMGLRKKLREQVKQREKSQQETYILKNKVKALKIEQDHAWKKIEYTKKAMSNLENVKKTILANKILQEENKAKIEKEAEEKKKVIKEKQLKTKEILETWKAQLTEKKKKEKDPLKEEKRELFRKINMDKQEEEERNKQTCIKIKTSHINCVDKKMKALEEKKKILKKEILDKLNEELMLQKTYRKEVKILMTEEGEIKKNLNTLDSSTIEDCKFSN